MLHWNSLDITETNVFFLALTVVLVEELIEVLVVAIAVIFPVTFSMKYRILSLIVTWWMVFTNVFQSLHDVEYPFLNIRTEPALSTLPTAVLFLRMWFLAHITINCPVSLIFSPQRILQNCTMPMWSSSSIWPNGNPPPHLVFDIWTELQQFFPSAFICSQ